MQYNHKLQWHRPAKFCYLPNFPDKRRFRWQLIVRQRLQVLRWLAVPIATLLLAGMTSNHLSEILEIETKTNAPLSKEPQITRADWHEVTVRRGDNLSLIFGRLGLSKADLDRILSLSEETASLEHLYPGQNLRFLIQDGELSELIYEEDLTRTLHIYKTDGQFKVKGEVTEPEKRVSMTTVTIKNSLFLAGQAAGLSDKVIMQLINIFGWDIDLALGIHEGDSFAVIYEELSKDGIKVKDGEILAAEFINQDKVYRAVRYVDEQGYANYYSEQGQGMRKEFLRMPLKFTRISSYFNLKRRHPVLHTIRAHRGADYAAPHGTPVKATGDGKVRFIGNKGGYGKTLILQHGKQYRTLYAHLSGYARGMRYGKFVRQGEIIGYVGKTGLATGPHLHYEFRINNVHQNPLTVPLPRAIPIPKKYMADFKMKAQTLFSQLEMLTRTHASALDLNASQPKLGYALAATPSSQGQ